MWFFAVNGLAYITYNFISGEWRDLVPNRESLRGSVAVVLHELGLDKRPLPAQKFNHAQRITYIAVVLMGAGSLITGLAIYKPSQLHVLTSLLGGYEMARWFHFWLTLGYVGFFLVHIAQVIRAGWNSFRAMLIGYQVTSTNSSRKEASESSGSVEVESEDIRRWTRRSFLVAGVAAAAGGGLWEWLNNWCLCQ